MELITAVAILVGTFLLGYFARSLDLWIARKIDDPAALKKLNNKVFWWAAGVAFVLSGPIIGLIMYYLNY